MEQANYLAMTADVVASYVSNNSVRPSDLDGLIKSVYEALSMTAVTPVQEEMKGPAVPVKNRLRTISLFAWKMARSLSL